jgi:hypothetical protein
MTVNDTAYRDEDKEYLILYNLREKLLAYRYNLDPSSILLFNTNRKISLRTELYSGNVETTVFNVEMTVFIRENKNVKREYSYDLAHR